MKKVLNFSKGFIPCAVFSALIIIFGVIGFVTKGINFGIDFRPGLIEEVRIASPAISVTYTGSANATVELSKESMTVVISGIGADNKTEVFTYADCPSVNDIAAALNSVDGIQASVNADGETESFYMFLNSAVSTQLSKSPLYVYARNADTAIDDIREALADVHGVSVKNIGSGAVSGYQIRMPAATEADSSDVLQETVLSSLGEKFGSSNVAVIKTDFIGAGFSKTLASKSVILLLCTVVLIWGYAAIRFHWDFALGAVVALIHDTLIMFTFIVWTQMEFTTTVLAAVLTIIGYSINATVVILDRIRFNLTAVKVTKFSDLINSALSDTLGRSLITTLTTLFAVVSLYIFTTGSIKDFALALIVGLISGCYSSIFISGGFIQLLRRGWKPEYGIHHSEKAMKKGVLDMSAGVTV